MTINSALGYRPSSYQELTQDEQFWAGCRDLPASRYFDAVKERVVPLHRYPSCLTGTLPLVRATTLQIPPVGRDLLTPSAIAHSGQLQLAAVSNDGYGL